MQHFLRVTSKKVTVIPTTQKKLYIQTCIHGVLNQDSTECPNSISWGNSPTYITFTVLLNGKR